MTSPERVIVVGASGFGRECLDVLEAMAAAGAAVTVVGVVDDGPSRQNLARLAARRVAYLGTLTAWLAAGVGETRYVLGIGDPLVRRRLVALLDEAGARPRTAIHPTATLGSGGGIGEGVIICAGAVISTNVRLGRHVHVNPNATIGHDAALSDFVSVNPAAVVSGEVKVGDGTLIGAASVILQGLAVGRRSVIGAGAVLTKDAPGDVVIKGVPGSW